MGKNINFQLLLASRTANNFFGLGYTTFFDKHKSGDTHSKMRILGEFS